MRCWCLTSQGRAVIALNERTLRGHFFFTLIFHFLWFAVFVQLNLRRFAVQAVLLHMLL